MEESRFAGVARRWLYNRWFYAFLAGACVLDAVSQILDIADPGENLALDVISLVCSAIAAVMSAAMVLDLQSRRGKS